jgi:HEAT repeat protein
MGEGSVPHQLVLSLRYELDEGLPLAREVINDASHHSFVRQNAILVIAKMGSTNDAKLLTPLLDDDTVCVRSYDIQIRDVALAALIHLANEDFGNYGMSEIQRESTMVFRLTSLRFKSGALREAAIQAWRAKHQ